jgi:transglutaminase-like putative cysteine protease
MTMRLAIRHHTTYRYSSAVAYALQQLRLTPKDRPGQRVIDWRLEVTGGETQLCFNDQHANHVDLVSIARGGKEIVLSCTGTIETEDRHGIVGAHGGHLPLWYFTCETPLTRAGKGVRALTRAVAPDSDPVARLHALAALVRATIAYAPGLTGTSTTAEQALTLGSGVCQDHAHSFCAAARLLGFPARYVSGYLLMNDRQDQDATHGWAEAHVDAIGWIGFDVSNGISPDARYVRVATGLDYREAAPVTGMHFGGTGEEMLVTVNVAQQ